MILLQIHFRKCMLIKFCGYDPMFMFTNSLNRDNQGTGNTNILALTRQFLKSSWRWLEICMLLKDCIFSIFFKYNIYRLTCFWDGSYEIEDDFRIQLDALSWWWIKYKNLMWNAQMTYLSIKIFSICNFEAYKKS